MPGSGTGSSRERGRETTAKLATEGDLQLAHLPEFSSDQSSQRPECRFLTSPGKIILRLRTRFSPFAGRFPVNLPMKALWVAGPHSQYWRLFVRLPAPGPILPSLVEEAAISPTAKHRMDLSRDRMFGAQPRGLPIVVPELPCRANAQ